ncbi:MAG: zinc-ribbon domain-containing protein, partial [Acidobacteriota bacterium]
MDVRCEKCQTEYELDESRLKPGGVTVKCTNCGHMFKIRKRSNTNVGVPTVSASDPRTKPISARTPVTSQAVTVASPAPTAAAPNVTPPGGAAVPEAAGDFGSGPNADKQWLIRLANGDQKSCRELATLQQWIVAGIVDRESLISRTGKTWKRLGDIPELGQYFVIAEEAKAQRTQKPTGKPGASTVLGVGARPATPTSPDDDLERRSTGAYQRRQPTPPPPPPGPQRSSGPIAMAQTELSTGPNNTPAPRRPPTQPPPPPRPKGPTGEGDRQTGAWAAADIKPSHSMIEMPQGPSGGKLAAIPAEPAFAGRVRVEPSDERSFQTGKVRMADDDDDLLPRRGGSRAGLWIAIVSLLVIAGAATVVYMVVFRDKNPQAAQAPPAPADAKAVATVASGADAAPVVTAIIDAPPPPSPLDTARIELAGGVETKMKPALDALAGKDDAASLAMRARLTAAIAQSMIDRAGLVDKAEGDKLRKDAKQLVVDAATLAGKALKAQADDASANLAMADVLRLQGKPAREVQRYLDAAKAKAAGDAELVRSVALVG